MPFSLYFIVPLAGEEGFFERLCALVAAKTSIRRQENRLSATVGELVIIFELQNAAWVSLEAQGLARLAKDKTTRASIEKSRLRVECWCKDSTAGELVALLHDLQSEEDIFVMAIRGEGL